MAPTMFCAAEADPASIFQKPCSCYEQLYLTEFLHACAALLQHYVVFAEEWSLTLPTSSDQCIFLLNTGFCASCSFLSQKQVGVMVYMHEEKFIQKKFT